LTQNGARFLGREAEFGTVAVGKRAGVVLIKGDPAAHVSDIENVEPAANSGA
jgi:enamidase